MARALNPVDRSTLRRHWREGVPPRYLLADGRTVDAFAMYDVGNGKVRLAEPGATNVWLRDDNRKYSFTLDQVYSVECRLLTRLYGSTPRAIHPDCWAPSVSQTPVSWGRAELAEFFSGCVLSGMQERWAMKKLHLTAAYEGGIVRLARQVTYTFHRYACDMNLTSDIQDESNLLNDTGSLHAERSTVFENMSTNGDSPDEVASLWALVPGASSPSFPFPDRLRHQDMTLRRSGPAPMPDIDRVVRLIAPTLEAVRYLCASGLPVQAIDLVDDTPVFRISRGDHSLELNLRSGTVSGACAHSESYEASRRIAELTDTIADFEAAVLPHVSVLL
jgi:hypothetical protein